MILTRDSIEDFLNSLSGNGRSPHTISAYRTDLLEMLEFLTVTPPGNLILSNPTAANYLTQGRKFWSPRTTQRKYTSLRTYAKSQGVTDFLSDYRLPIAAEPEPHPLPEGIAGVLRMIEVAAGDRQRALVALCGLCGLRVGEAVQVTPMDVTTAGGNSTGAMLYVRGKGAKDRRVPIHEGFAWLTIKKVLPLGPNSNLCDPMLDYSQGYARRLITNLAKKAKLSRPVSSHDLRATFATAAYEVSHDIEAVRRLLGHSDIKTTQRYIGRTAEQMRAAADVTGGL